MNRIPGPLRRVSHPEGSCLSCSGPAEPLTIDAARPVHRARRRDVASLLDTLSALGPVEHTDAG
jgi:hypothetical protein